MILLTFIREKDYKIFNSSIITTLKIFIRNYMELRYKWFCRSSNDPPVQTKNFINKVYTNQYFWLYRPLGSVNKAYTVQEPSQTVFFGVTFSQKQ